MTYEVGGASSPEDAYQRHAGHEWGYVLTGSLQVRIGFEEFVLGPGDAISINSTIPHRLANIGDVPVDRDLVRAGARPVRRPDAHRRAPHAAGRGRRPVRLSTRPGGPSRGRTPRAPRASRTWDGGGRRRPPPWCPRVGSRSGDLDDHERVLERMPPVPAEPDPARRELVAVDRGGDPQALRAGGLEVDAVDLAVVVELVGQRLLVGAQGDRVALLEPRRLERSSARSRRCGR